MHGQRAIWTPLARPLQVFGCEFFISYGMTECCGKISMSILPEQLELLSGGRQRRWEEVMFVKWRAHVFCRSENTTSQLLTLALHQFPAPNSTHKDMHPCLDVALLQLRSS